jgi:hypothetical protein
MIFPHAKTITCQDSLGADTRRKVSQKKRLVLRIGFTQAVADVSVVSGGCYMGGGIKNASGWFGAYYIPCPGDSSKLAKVGEVKVSF